MGAKLLLAAMLLGTPAVMVLGARSDVRAVVPPPPKYREKPWLTHEAAGQLIAPGGAMGPLFAGVLLGGSEPPAPIRERIAAFANQHGVDIDLEMEDGNVASVKLGVTFDGGYGYQGADVLALRFDRPSRGTCCVCGPSDYWFNDWGIGLDDGSYVHTSVRVNRVEVRWMAGMSTTDVIDLAETLVGVRMSEVRRRYGNRLVGHALEIPHVNPGGPYVSRYGEFAMYLFVTDERVDGVRVGLRNWTSEHEQENTRALTKRLGKPDNDGTWSRRRGNQVIEASADSFTIRTEPEPDAAP